MVRALRTESAHATLPCADTACAAPTATSDSGVQCLVDGGADVNAVDNNGMQPVDLAMASVTNREAVLEVLRAADATLRVTPPRDAARCGACLTPFAADE